MGLPQKDYCPPIDPSLFSAIVSDYDLSTPSSIDELRNTLDTLKESAVAEETVDFDPSGSSGIQDGTLRDSSSPDASERARSWHGDDASVATEDTELTGLSQNFGTIDLDGDSKLGVGDSEGVQHPDGLEDLSPDKKSVLLKEMFPNAKEFDINYTLKKAHNHFGKAVEELLNQAFLDDGDIDGEIVSRIKGIEAFTEPAINVRKRRGRRKQRQLLRRTSSTPASPADDSTANSASRSRWDRAKEDVDFIAQRTFIPPQIISSMYHKNGASLSATIAACCASTDPDFNPNPYLAMASPLVLEAHASELAVDFQRVPFPQLTALIALTHPSTASAHELARAMTSQMGSSSAKLVPQYLPRPPSPDFDVKSSAVNDSLQLSSSTAASLSVTRSNAFTQAQSAYRRSRSKPLMGGAAAYYSSVGREASASLRRHEAAAAESLVTSQSKPGEVDLHGVTVRDAVNISRVKVESWWEREGREWSRQGKVMGNGLRIVTGAGRHSEGGRGKLGPAVGGMLVREGWKVEIGDGVIEVVGRARR